MIESQPNPFSHCTCQFSIESAFPLSNTFKSTKVSRNRFKFRLLCEFGRRSCSLTNFFGSYIFGFTNAMSRIASPYWLLRVSWILMSQA